MGMDVCGRSGNYFRANVWAWHPLWKLCKAFAPAITAKVTYGDYNCGDGLGATDAATLAEMLTAALDCGDVARYIEGWDEARAAVPDEECHLCQGSGTRTDTIGVQQGMAARHWCNGCDGKGKRRPSVTWYSVDVETVCEFRDFLAASGGFEIW